MPSSQCANHHQCQKTALATAEAHCDKFGERLTPNRRDVLRLIWQSHRPIKAYDLIDLMSAQDAKVKPATVYRALDFLLAQGLIHKIDSLSAFTGCSHPNQHDDCYFLICQSCGTAQECCSPLLAEAITSEARQQDFKLTRTVLEIAGQCATCHQTAPTIAGQEAR